VGYEAREAADAAQGVRTYQRAPTDLVLCDLFRPELEGLTTLRKLLLLNPAVKVVAVGDGVRPDRNDLEMARGMCAVATLAKPFRIDELLGAVRRALRR
jgi:DNA-binding response OmpR family regulator